MKIEHPEGIPLARGYEDYGAAFSGNLLLTYEPPIVMKTSISIGVIARINGTTDSFSGTLESKFAGDVFIPGNELISSVQECVKRMADEMKESDQHTIALVIEEMLGYVTVNLPVKQVYEKIRIEYPVEFRSINLDYKRKSGKTIQEDIMKLQSKQRLYRFAELLRPIIRRAMIRKAFAKDDVVTLNTEALDKLKKTNPAQYASIEKELKNIAPINGNYIIIDVSADGCTIAGKDKSGKYQYAKTDIKVPFSIINSVGDDLEDYSPTHKKEMDKKRQKEQQLKSQEQQKGQQSIVDAMVKKYFVPNGIPTSVFTDVKEAADNAETIQYVYNMMKKNGEVIPDQLEGLMSSVNATVEQRSMANLMQILKEVQVPSNQINDIFTVKQVMLENKDKIFDAYTKMQEERHPIPKQFQNVIDYLKESGPGVGEGDQQAEVEQALERAKVPIDALEHFEIAKMHIKPIMNLYESYRRSGKTMPDNLERMVVKLTREIAKRKQKPVTQQPAANQQPAQQPAAPQQPASPTPPSGPLGQ